MLFNENSQKNREDGRTEKGGVEMIVFKYAAEVFLLLYALKILARTVRNLIKGEYRNVSKINEK